MKNVTGTVHTILYSVFGEWEENKIEIHWNSIEIKKNSWCDHIIQFSQINDTKLK